MESFFVSFFFLQIFLYDYLIKRGYNNTAEIFKTEAQVTTTPTDEYDIYPNGLLCDQWTLFYRSHTKQQPMEASSSTQAPILDIAHKLFREGYVPKFLGGFPSKDILLACDFSSDGKIVASGGYEKKVFLCYMDTCDSITTSEAHSAKITDIKFKPGSSIFATSSADKTIKLWDAAKPSKFLFNLGEHNGWLRSLDFHPTDGILASSDSFDVIELWNVDRRLKLKNFMAGGRRVRFQPGIGKLLAIANGKFINILDIQTWRVQNRFQGHLNDVLSICWDTTGQMIGSVSEDSARVWSLSVCGHCLYTIDLTGKRCQSIIFHPRYHNVLLIGGQQCMQMWISESGKLLTIPVSNGSITGLAASTQNKCIASSSSDSMVKIWK